MGVLIRNAEVIESMRKVDTLVIDKTGTLTLGKPKLVTVERVGSITEDEILILAASLEQSSEHPLAASILAKAKEKNLVLKTNSDFKSLTGKGATCFVEGKLLALGNLALMNEFSVNLKNAESIADRLREDGQTVMFLAIDRNIEALLGVLDPIKETSIQAVKALQKAGLKIVMISGDNKKTVELVARKVGVDLFYSDVLPQGKLELIKTMQSEGRFVAMAGDGINDAPALAQAQVGIAMGTGTDVAMSSAGITLIKGDLMGIVRARVLSEDTIRNIKQNLFFAFVYNTIGIPIAAGVFYPMFGILLSPVFAAAAMSLSSVSVIGNALRLKKS
jgi:Cu+-exporting ATPase